MIQCYGSLCWQVVVRRVAVGAGRRLTTPDFRGLAVEAVVEGLDLFLVAVSALVRHVLATGDRGRVLDRMRVVAGDADRPVLAFLPQLAVRTLDPDLEDAFVATAAGLRAARV